MGDRLFDQPVVKVLPDGSELRGKQITQQQKAKHGSTIARLKSSKINLADLPPPPSMSSLENLLPTDKEQNPQADIAPAQPDDTSATPPQHPSTELQQEVSPPCHSAEQPLEEPSIPSADYLTTNTANENNPRVAQMLKKQSEPEPAIEPDYAPQINSESSGMPSYAQQPQSNAQQATNSTQSSEVPLYARFSAPTAAESNSNTQGNSNNDVPLYAQFNNLSVSSAPQPQPQAYASNQNSMPSYLQNLANPSASTAKEVDASSPGSYGYNANANVNVNANASNSDFAASSFSQPSAYTSANQNANMNNNTFAGSSCSNQFASANVAPLMPSPPKFIPTRDDYVMYHGYRSQSNAQAPAPAPTTQPTAWMNVYSQRSDEDETFVLREWFKSVDQDNSGEIDAEELEAALNAAGDKFEKGTVRLMVKIFDIDRNGTIDFNEFARLFKYINVMRQSFESFDSRKCGFLALNEMQSALKNARYDFRDPHTFQMLFYRFAKGKQGISFEDFMQVAIFLGNLRTLFTLHDSDKRGEIQLNEEEFILLDCAPYS